MKRPWLVLSAVVLSAGLAAGCATANAIQKAEKSLGNAKAAGGESKSPFEYYAAEGYLKKANLEAEEGDCKAADAFTMESEAYSAKALEKAGRGGK